MRGLKFNNAGGGVSPQPEPSSVALIPTMTSNTTPSGVASASSVYNNNNSQYGAWTVFKDTETTKYWSTNTGQVTNQYLRYSFTDGERVVKSLTLTNRYLSGGRNIHNFKLQYLNSSSQWVDVPNAAFSNPNTEWQTEEYFLTTPIQCYGIGIFVIDNWGASDEINLIRLQFYGYKVVNPSYLYKDGTWNVSYQNRGDYTWTASSDNDKTIPAQMLSNKIYCPVTSGKLYLFGTTDPINLTNYARLYIEASGIGNLSYDVYCAINSSKLVTEHIARVKINSNTAITIYSIDITNINTYAYICFYTTQYGYGFEVYKLWLE